MRFIGSKRMLLDNIKEVIDRHVQEAESFCDIFSGTVSVARYFKKWYKVYSNDLLYFSYVLQRATIDNQSIPLFNRLDIGSPVSYINSIPDEVKESLPQDKRFFQNNYSPKGSRMYLTDINALRIDYARNIVEDWYKNDLLTETEYYYLVAGIVEGIPFVSNISGTFSSYNKQWDPRTKKIFEVVELPVFNNERDNKSFNKNGVDLIKEINGDILYIDPPYNERQYPPNYHILETAARYDNPVIRGKTGMREYNSQKSEFCSKKTAYTALEQILNKAKFKHILMSYNTDGIMDLKEIEDLFRTYCVSDSVEVNFIPYRRFKSRPEETRTENLKEVIVYGEKD